MGNLCCCEKATKIRTPPTHEPTPTATIAEPIVTVVPTNANKLENLSRDHLISMCIKFRIEYKRNDTKPQLRDRITKHFGPVIPDHAFKCTVRKMGPVSSAMRARLWAHWMGPSVDEAKCPLCDETIKRTSPCWHASHVVAAANGGETVLENLRVLCAKCNLSMHDEHMRDYVLRVAPDRLRTLGL